MRSDLTFFGVCFFLLPSVVKQNEDEDCQHEYYVAELDFIAYDLDRNEW